MRGRSLAPLVNARAFGMTTEVDWNLGLELLQT
jgi:hypothetical protein